MANRIKAARQDREWSQSRLIGELERVAARRGVELPSRETLKSRVSRWENNHAKPDEFYRQLLREALGLDDRELGFEQSLDDLVAPAAEELRARLNATTAVDRDLLQALRTQTEAIRLQDRQYGAGVLLEQMRAHVANLEQHLHYTVLDSSRRPLAQVLSDAAALAGWQALDVGAADQAWRFFEVASRAAQQAGDQALYAFSRMEQAHVLADLGQAQAAAKLGESVWDQAQRLVAPVVRCWLSAATAEMAARAGDAGGAVQLLLKAEAGVDSLDEERPPYLVFNATHLERWVGHTLVILEDPAAERRLRQAEMGMDSSFTRASASLNLDLAAAVRQRGEREEAVQRIARAEMLARKVGSRRLLARAGQLRGAL